MTDATPVLAAIATVALLLGGGIAMATPFGEELDEEVEPASRSDDEAAMDGSQADEDDQMTVEESERTDEGTEATVPPFYASRVITVEGTMTLDELPVELGTTNGAIDVHADTGETYALVANLTAYGATPEEARDNRDEMRFTWDAGEPGDRHLVGHVEHDTDEDGDPLTVNADRTEVHLELVVPEDVRLGLLAGSTNGAIDVAGLQASSLLLESTNGEVAVTDTQAAAVEIATTNGRIETEVAGTQQVLLGSTNGAVEATVTPGSSGSIEAGSTNGDVDVLVPETGERGYRATATTTNGQASIALEEGSTEASDDGDHVLFQTDGFEDRSIQTTILASSTNGDAHVGPQ